MSEAKTLDEILQEKLNEHFQISKEEQELAETQWDETVKAVKEAVAEWIIQQPALTTEDIAMELEGLDFEEYEKESGNKWINKDGLLWVLEK